MWRDVEVYCREVNVWKGMEGGYYGVMIHVMLVR